MARPLIEAPLGFYEWLESKFVAGDTPGIAPGYPVVDAVDDHIAVRVMLNRVPYAKYWQYLRQTKAGVNTAGITKMPLYFDEVEKLNLISGDERLYCTAASPAAAFDQTTVSDFTVTKSTTVSPFMNLELVFENPTWFVNGFQDDATFEGLIISEDFETSTEFITTDSADLVWGEDIPATPADPQPISPEASPGKIIRFGTWKVRLHYIPDSPEFAISSVYKLTGKVNADVLYSPTFGMRFDKNSLLMSNPRVTPGMSPWGVRQYTIDFVMLWNPSYDWENPVPDDPDPPWASGWNVFERPGFDNRVMILRWDADSETYEPNQFYQATAFGNWLPTWSG